MKRWTQDDTRRLHAGTHHQLYERLGAFPHKGGIKVRAWIPDVSDVQLVGEFNAWAPDAHPMKRKDGAIWEVFVPEAETGSALQAPTSS